MKPGSSGNNPYLNLSTMSVLWFLLFDDFVDEATTLKGRFSARAFSERGEMLAALMK